MARIIRCDWCKKEITEHSYVSVSMTLEGHEFFNRKPTRTVEMCHGCHLRLLTELGIAEDIEADDEGFVVYPPPENRNMV